MDCDRVTLEDFDDNVKEQFTLLRETLDLQNSGYTVSFCHYLLEHFTVSNKQIK